MCWIWMQPDLKYVQYTQQMVRGWAVLSKDDIYVCGFGWGIQKKKHEHVIPENISHISVRHTK